MTEVKKILKQGAIQIGAGGSAGKVFHLQTREN